MSMNIYAALTHEFNASGRLRAVISSGQAVVLHRLAIMSKDGDWILREDEEALRHVLEVLSRHGAQYRLSAPLDLRWMQGGWSAHLQFCQDNLRIRTDFVTRPPRISPEELARIWESQEGKDIPVVDLPSLAKIKKTNREKDYAIIGELARKMVEPRQQLLHARSARDLIALADEHEALGEQNRVALLAIRDAEAARAAAEVRGRAFNWGDAAIGAGVGAVVAVVASAIVVVVATAER